MDRETAEPRVETMPGERAREWAAHHRRTAARSTYVYDFVWDITAEAVGPFCTDVDGNVLLDFTSHVAAAPLGYNNPLITERFDEFDLPDPTKIAGQDFYVGSPGTPEDPDLPGPTQLLDRLIEITSEYGMDRAFLSNSGAEAVENAIKSCYDATDGTRGITFEGGFHGRTLGALSLNRSKSVQRAGYPELAGITDVPYCTERSCTPESCGCGFFREDGSALATKLDRETGHLPPEDLAYLVLEPVQGEGGYRIPSEAFMREVADVCTDHDVLLIADEIQTGLGRTGEMWGSDHYPIEPDVITCAKGLRVGATISRSDVFPEEGARISSTWGAGDLLASMQGALTVDAIREEGLLENARLRGEQAKELLRDAAPEGVVDVRGLGLLLAVEFDSKERREAVIEAALKRGLLTLGCGHRTLRLLPPLDVTEREIGIGIDLLCEAIAAVDG
ncbi:class-III pyridoxal-phosphate-dependent aminotransferase [Halalkalicoccus jeotgali]|uniref:4-aminobutyrate aminotransferase n=1 Tax=Halalkalicoccus jeotgali (strain DSM 18796 / CECT 7217 / JCM 14584 / KCTC 4019 / B3) TaxID=795797 RepID=D8J383_HALJB|nr:aminotransferase class III-fold pyridoxal phosphate-dependent enzyme [Halalkalicoccus jeotgali]ADJ15190.1 4-aminobutyrate aminotransferase [Halalkalicoccus jeotgali B3]ELY35233.1 4-aminobutyrate aminotransferase [Halalkalicoccus jeotgali B3]